VERQIIEDAIANTSYKTVSGSADIGD
jgi:hypothetical protein